MMVFGTVAVTLASAKADKTARAKLEQRPGGAE
jgi:hypothetical protein